MRYALIFVFSLFMVFVLKAQNSITGIIYGENAQPLQGSIILNINGKLLCNTDENGRFKILNQEVKKICISNLGYIDTCITINNSTKNLEIHLKEKIVTSKDVFIRTNKMNKNTHSIQGGLFELRTDSVRHLPSISGEADPLKMLQLTPGVSKSEFSMGLNVRGSSTDQNMVIVDDAVIYNPTHLAGFLSVFNPLVTEKVTLIKSGIPAYYGGRLSSVTEIESNKNIPEKLLFSLNSGILLTGLSIKAPIFDKKVGLTFAVRKSYFNFTVKPLSQALMKKSLFNQTSYEFYDVNFGLTLAPSLNDRIFVNSYLGNDNFNLYKASFDISNQMNWGNDAVSVKWMHRFGNQHIMKTVTYMSECYFNLFLGQNDYKIQIKSRIRDLSVTHEHTIFFDNFSIKSGIQVLNQFVIPNQSEAKLSGLEANLGSTNKYHSITLSLYTQIDYNFNTKLAFSAGLRYNLYSHLGPFIVYDRTQIGEISDTIYYKNNKLIKQFNNFEPRLNIRYLLNESSSLKFSATRNVQYLHQVNVSSVSFPTDFWMPSTTLLEPQKGEQFSVGYFYNNSNNTYEASVETFYKQMRGLPEFKSDFFTSVSKASMEENLITGKGWAYGIEFLINKKLGKLTGWLSYTLSRTERQFKEINDGNPYPAKYDHTHDLSIVSQYQINSKWNVSTVFVYSTGNAITIPDGRYVINGNILNQYSKFNSSRMPAYHRLDLSVTRTIEKRANREQILNFSLYNAYNRSNPFYMYFHASGDLTHYKLVVEPKMVSVFPIIPSLSYELRF